MELGKCIESRRSIRRFKSVNVSEDIIKKLIDTAIFAPSWKNTQVTRYYAVVNEEIKDKLVKAMPEFNKQATETAPVIIVSTVVKERSGYNREGGFETTKGNGWQMYDCGLSNMLFCLEATEQGLGTVIMGYYDEDYIRQLLPIAETEEVTAVIALGYPDEEPLMPKRKDTDAILKIIK